MPTPDKTSTGPQLYEEARALVNDARAIPSENDETNPAAALLLAEAQVLATLSLVAATVDAARGAKHMTGPKWDEWYQAGVR